MSDNSNKRVGVIGFLNIPDECFDAHSEGCMWVIVIQLLCVCSATGDEQAEKMMMAMTCLPRLLRLIHAVMTCVQMIMISTWLWPEHSSSSILHIVSSRES